MASAASVDEKNIDDEDTSGLAVQDLSKLVLSELTPLTPNVISRQATINIGIQL